MMGLFCLTSAFPLLSRDESGGLASDRVSLPFLLPFPLPLPRPLPFPLPLGGAPMGCGKSVLMKLESNISSECGLSSIYKRDADTFLDMN